MLIVVHQLEPDGHNSLLALSQSEYSAVLGHLNVYTPSQNSNFPPSASWAVGGKYIKWSSGSEGSAKVLAEVTEYLGVAINLRHQTYLFLCVRIYVFRIGPDSDSAEVRGKGSIGSTGGQ